MSSSIWRKTSSTIGSVGVAGDVGVGGVPCMVGIDEVVVLVVVVVVVVVVGTIVTDEVADDVIVDVIVAAGDV